MKLFKDFDIRRDREALEDFLKDYPGGTALTLGKFDGLHAGHQKLISDICSHRRNAEGKRRAAVVIAFGKATYRVVANEFRKTLTEARERSFLLENTDVDLLVEFPFTEELMQMEAETFLKEVLSELFAVTYLSVGDDFCFGRGRRGNREFLQSHVQDFTIELSCIPRMKDGDDIISSTLISGLLEEGNVTRAAKLLGHPYFALGCVEHGAKIGRTIGFPTLNISCEGDKVLPLRGVYETKVTLLSTGECYNGITNVGMKPTVKQSDTQNIETHLLDYTGNLYDAEIRVEFLHFERPEVKFSDLTELQSQLNRDLEEAKKYFQKN